MTRIGTRCNVLIPIDMEPISVYRSYSGQHQEMVYASSVHRRVLLIGNAGVIHWPMMTRWLCNPAPIGGRSRDRFVGGGTGSSTG